MQIIPLSEGSFTVDRSKAFTPFDPRKDDLQQRPAGSLLVEVQPFLVITSVDVLLLDTGLGFSTNGELQLHKNMREKGIQPSEVTRVLLSHLHKDHAGGISDREQPANGLSFPNALYYVQDRELNNALEKGSASYLTAQLEQLRKSPQVVLLQDQGSINRNISYELTSAHSAFHQVFWIREAAEVIFFGGDDAPQLQQMKHRFVAKYDFDGRKAMELRKKWWDTGTKEGWRFLFYHDVSNPVY
jgi:glyoxylase-like metal-dependent hydrolase (beta-lactamase superfamily II)